MATNKPTNPPMPMPTAPELFKLTGRELLCYRAGEHIGTFKSFTAAAGDTRRLKTHMIQELALLRRQLIASLPDDHPLMPAIETLPVLAEALDQVAQQYDTLASQNQQQGNLTVGKLAADNILSTAQEPPQGSLLSRWVAPCLVGSLLLLMALQLVILATS